MTELLYYSDTAILEFDARITGTGEDKTGPYLELDRTAFYPEGGGQPADRGTINGFSVADVQKNEGVVRHYIDLPDEHAVIPESGSRAACMIDGAHRLDYMQQHTGQHLLSAAMFNTAGIETVSVRQGADYTAIETSAEAISAETLRLIENEANGYIRQHVEIKTCRTDAEGLRSFSLRRPSKHTSNIRIVEIPGIDCVACGGMHLAYTSQAGLVKFIYQEKIRSHVRTYWKIGKRAYDDYAEKTDIINTLNDFYSARQNELPEKAAAAGAALVDERFHRNKLEQEYAALYADKLLEPAGGAVVAVFEDKSKGFITSLLKAVTELEYSSPVFIFNRAQDILTWAAAAPAGCSFDFNSFRQEMLPLIDGKGGGKPPFWQGVAQNPAGLEKLTAALKA